MPLKKNIIISCIVFVLVLITGYSCNNYSVSEKQAGSFLKYYAIDVEDNEGSEVIQTADGGYLILANYSQQGPAGTDRDILLIFCDEFGRASNDSPVRIGTAGYDRGESIIRSGADYIIAGSSHLGSTTYGYLSKIDNNGQLIWQKNYGGFSDMEFNEVILHQDGGFIMTGYVIGNNGESNIILLKTNSDGDSLWTREIGYNGYNDVGESLERYQDRLLIIGTTSPVNPSERSRILILNTNTDGRGIFAMRIEGGEDLYGKEILLDTDGDLYIMGNEENAVSFSRIYLARLKLTGSALEQVEMDSHTYLNELKSVWGEDLESTESGGMTICGWELDKLDKNIYFASIDNEFQLIHRQTFGSKGYQAAQGLYFTNDEGYSLTGAVDLGGGITTMLLKLDNTGNLQ